MEPRMNHSIAEQRETKSRKGARETRSIVISMGTSSKHGIMAAEIWTAFG